MMHLSSYLLDTLSVLDHEPIWINDRFNVELCENFDCIILHEFQSVQLHAEHFRKLRDPVHLESLSLFLLNHENIFNDGKTYLRCLIPVNVVVDHAFPGFIHILGFQDAQHDLNEGFMDFLGLVQTQSVLVVNERLEMTEKCVTNYSTFLLSALSLTLHLRLLHALHPSEGKLVLRRSFNHHIGILLFFVLSIAAFLDKGTLVKSHLHIFEASTIDWFAFRHLDHWLFCLLC
jgi:hypothetical protein